MVRNTGCKKFVCWDCRNCKQHENICEFCGAPMHYMGNKWRPPRRTAVRKWKVQQQRWEQGRHPDGNVYRYGRLVYKDWPICRWCGKPKDRNHPQSAHF